MTTLTPARAFDMSPPTPASRCLRLRECFEHVRWPTPWTVQANAIEPFVGVYFTDRQTRLFETAGITLNVKADHVHITDFDVAPDEQKAGIGRHLVAALFDELAGQGETLTRLSTGQCGSYMWARAGVQVSGFLPFGIERRIQATSLKMRRDEQRAMFNKWSSLLSGPGTRTEKLWRVSDIEDRLPDGSKASHDILYNAGWRGCFDAYDAACITRLKNYVPDYKFKYL